MSNHRSFMPLSGIMMSNENFDTTAENLTGADAIAPDESDTLAAAVSEITADEAGMAAGVEQIDAATAAADGLETISETVAAANEGDGIDEATAEIVEASVESILKVARIGIKFQQLGLPTTESFKVKANRNRLGVKTCEALDISAKKIWQSIVTAIKNSIEWVRNFFNKIFGAAENLEKRAKALKEKTTSLSGQPEEANLENNALYNAVRLNGAPAKPSDISDLAHEAVKLFAEQKKTVDEFGKVELGGGGASFFQPTPASYGLKPADSGTAKRVTAEGDIAVHVSSRFPGESVVFLAVPKAQGGADAKAYSDYASKIRAGSISLSDKKDEGKSLKTLSISEIQAIADSVASLANTVAAYKSNLTAINANKEKFVSKLEAYMQKDGKDEADSKGDASKKAKAEATIYRKLMDEPAASFASHSVKSMSSVLQYAELSARQYSKG